VSVAFASESSLLPSSSPASTPGQGKQGISAPSLSSPILATSLQASPTLATSAQASPASRVSAAAFSPIKGAPLACLLVSPDYGIQEGTGSSAFHGHGAKRRPGPEEPLHAAGTAALEELRHPSSLSPLRAVLLPNDKAGERNGPFLPEAWQ